MLLKPKSGRSRNISVPLAESELSSLNIFASLNDASRVALAVSGGSDSMAMLRLILEWAKARNNPPQIFILTVDHGLRVASVGEALQVGNWCRVLNLHHETLVWANDKPISGIQAKARKARYDLMAAWCVNNHVPILLTGHTADDQAETVLMRKARTSSAASLAGIWPERIWGGILIVRPLLKVRREELRHYLKSKNQMWIEDPSNDDARFERVRVRHSLMGEVHGFVDEAQAAQEEVKHDQRRADSWCEQNLKVHALGFVQFGRAAFLHLNHNARDKVILRLLYICGMHNAVERIERTNLAAWIAQNTGYRRSLGGALFAKRRAEIIVGREPGRISQVLVMIPVSGEVIWDGRFRVSGPVGAVVEANSPIPRNKDIPAFIQAGLPIVRMNGQFLDVGVKYVFLRD
jgi:tRNA(Ile)-lysidine synthase